MRTRILPIILPRDAYAQLEREARAQERDPLQQARWILKQALEAGESARLANDRLTTSAPTGPEAA